MYEPDAKLLNTFADCQVLPLFILYSKPVPAAFTVIEPFVFAQAEGWFEVTVKLLAGGVTTVTVIVAVAGQPALFDVIV